MMFAEFTCPFQEELVGIWTPMDSFVHVLQGRKTWKTTQGIWTASKGQTLYIRKGASIIQQHLEEEFCVLMLFVSDDFINQCVKEVADQMNPQPVDSDTKWRALNIREDIVLTAYFQSMFSYFTLEEKPSAPLLLLKLKELILNILLNGKNPELASYIRSLTGPSPHSLRDIMEANFSHNLSMADFASLCGRSPSKFKRDFAATFQTTPGKWLMDKRLQYAAMLLGNSSQQVTQIAFECGFEDVAHFSRSFKKKYGVSPSGFRDSTVGGEEN